MFNWLAEKYIDNKLISKAIKNLQVEFSPEHKKSLEHAVGLVIFMLSQKMSPQKK
ncbi:hypothetical protein HVF11_004649 [Salmonella enterica]|nr:hypothetical protein [Salmonella enterica]